MIVCVSFLFKRPRSGFVRQNGRGALLTSSEVTLFVIILCFQSVSRFLSRTRCLQWLTLTRRVGALKVVVVKLPGVVVPFIF